MTARLDHVMFGVPDLTATCAELAAGGLHFAPGGDHPAGTYNALAVSPRRQSYVELIAARDDPISEIGRLVRRGGLTAYAMGVDDIDAAVCDLTAAGFACSAVADGARRTGDGRRVQWRSATVGPGIGQSELPFLIEWPVTRGHRTGVDPDARAADVAEIEVGTRDSGCVQRLLATLGLRIDSTDEGPVCSDGEVTMRIVDAEPGLRSALLTRPDGLRVTLPMAASGVA